MKYNIKYNDTFIWLGKGKTFKFTYEKYLIELNKISLNDYYLFKGSGKQRVVDENNLREFKYSQYILFKKDNHCIDHINNWIVTYNNVLYKKKYIHFLNKPFPPYNPKRIKIMK